MQHPSDFPLHIEVDLREVDELQPTKPFLRLGELPGVRVRPARIPARSGLDAPIPPPRTHASPLTDADAARMQRRTQAKRRSEWARSLLRRFQWDDAQG